MFCTPAGLYVCFLGLFAIDAAKLACRILDPSRSPSSALAPWFVHFDACLCWGLVNHLLQECVSYDCCGEGKGGTWGCQLILFVCVFYGSFNCAPHCFQADLARSTESPKAPWWHFCQRIGIRNLARSRGPIVAVPVA